MNHPTREEWVLYLANENPPAEKNQLKQHLAQCPECAEQVAGWGRTLHKLDSWKMPPRVLPRTKPQPFLKWAAAAAIVGGLAFGLGRFSSPASADVSKLKREVEDLIRSSLQAELRRNEDLKTEWRAALADLQSQVTNQYQAQLSVALENTINDAVAISSRLAQRQMRELAQSFSQKLDTTREEERDAALSALNSFKTQYEADFLGIRGDLETLASTTDDQLQLQSARQKMLQLALNSTR